MRFAEDYPTSVVNTYAQLLVLINTNSAIQRWASAIGKEFSAYSETPEWLINDTELQNEWESSYQEVLLKFKEKKLGFAKRRSVLQESISEQLKLVDTDEETQVLEFYKQNPVLLINNISTQSLPFSITEKYLSLDTAGRKLNLKRELALYKQQLFKQFQRGELSYDELVEIVK
jgi:hypothetical protein